jgi:hypothetical protein
MLLVFDILQLILIEIKSYFYEIKFIFNVKKIKSINFEVLIHSHSKYFDNLLNDVGDFVVIFESM